MDSLPAAARPHAELLDPDRVVRPEKALNLLALRILSALNIFPSGELSLGGREMLKHSFIPGASRYGDSIVTAD